MNEDEDDEESEEDAEEENGAEDRFVFDDEDAQQVLGDRYDEFKERFERAVNANNLDALADLAADFGSTQFPAAGNSEGNYEKIGDPIVEPPRRRLSR
jgi:hypothetical protein